ncbi:flagellar biosynthesis anti-sigma factor FlgM [Novosphingobium profundi]|uniref:flagellar biosynthesis anti-sigma factor FlgM n=1 Tax=Novosphingobium profundi TaxID=1774954 RepID=UPI001BD9B2CD|nr:flagellar biosynthesis anti-sigma factor FlgM [Novosphingobium profundi]MBT0670403.1 flagellar biosynthesis anti-sigma factor FlgM [Novosphingobium profundi]
MPPIEVGPAQSVGPISARPARLSGGDDVTGVQPASPVRSEAVQTSQTTPSQTSPSVETSAALDPGAPPVDIDRVSVIRKAVEAGQYPVIPTQIADAMIAAGVLLRSPK